MFSALRELPVIGPKGGQLIATPVRAWKDEIRN
jgi:hypothetical protein